MKYERIKNYPEVKFRQATGVSPATFNVMVEILQKEYNALHKAKHGRHRKLSIVDMLLLTLEYYKEYRTYESIAASYGLAKQNICKIVHWVEETLIKDENFALPQKKLMRDDNSIIEVIIVDSTETPIQRPKKSQKKYYSGKKKTYVKNTGCN